MDLLLGFTFWGGGPANSDVQSSASLLPRPVSSSRLSCLMAPFHRLQCLSSAKVLAWLCPPRVVLPSQQGVARWAQGPMYQPRFEGATLRGRDSGGLTGAQESGPQVFLMLAGEILPPHSPRNTGLEARAGTLGYERRTRLLIMVLVEQVNYHF